ncbi:enolase 4-like [Anneissia japonica]|uniref:enolase 4-like n=1 Tax=Anneissia japonica TaxID=1529436 RepID=UPI0014255AD1|nr:enolase 4-like [Anneissia japonica]
MAGNGIMSGCGASQRHALELYELKKKAVIFYQENNVPERIEEILNSLFSFSYSLLDLYKRQAEYFSQLSKPATISQVVGREILDCKGQPTIEIAVYCILNGVEKLVCTCKASSFTSLPEGASLEKKEVEEKERSKSITSALKVIDECIVQILKGVQPSNQNEADKLLSELAEKLQKEHEETLATQKEQGSEPLLTAAKGPAKEGKVSSARSKKKSGSARSGVVVIEEPKEMMAPGCDAFCVSSQAVARAAASIKNQPLYQYLAHLYSNQVRTFWFIQSYHSCVKEKGKYEILSGMMKTADDMIEIYSDLITRYSLIVGVIDPLRKQDADAWQKLIERISEKCFLIGDHVYPCAERLVKEGFGGLPPSATVLKLQQQTTITDVINTTKYLKDSQTEYVLSTVQGDTEDDFIADLAVGIGAKFVKFGGLSRGERIAKYNRLLQIENQLSSKNLSMPYDALNIPNILPPPPEEDETNTQEPVAVS